VQRLTALDWRPVKRLGPRTVCAAALVALAAAAACHARPPQSGASGARPRPAIPRRVELRQVQDRPSISLVSRLGDPQPAMAVAVAHDLGSVASVGLAAVTHARLRRSGFVAAQVRAHHLGFQLRTLVASPRQAAAFVQAVTQALAEPITSETDEWSTVRSHLEQLSIHSWSSSTEAAVSACSGELGMGADRKQSELDRLATADGLERWRTAVYSTQAVAFAALGPDTVLDAATQALRATAAWPRQPGVQDPWPKRDAAGHALSLALRVADGSSAIEAARQLGRPDSPLGARLSALRPAWRLERAVGTTRPRGACLRVDINAAQSETAPPLTQVADVALIALEEAKVALAAGADKDWTLEQSVLQAADPRAAAAAAAWRALSGRLRPGAERRFISYAAPTAPRPAPAQLSRALRQRERQWSRPTLEHRVRVEPGQGELWALLACPCGTRSETAHNAGEIALLVRALVEMAGSQDDIALEPWITPDGLGLLAHGPARSPFEQPTDHARRLGSALGRALAASSLDGVHVAAARTRLLEEVGPRPRAGWWLALDAVAPGRPSWLDPRGSWSALVDIAAPAVEKRRRAFVTGPLRLAVLANWSEKQPPAVAEGLQRWLRPLRLEQSHCAPVTRVPPRRGRFDLETAGTSPASTAYVAIPLPGGNAQSQREAEWTLLLLNRRGGWLDQSLRVSELVSSAQARLVGGRAAAALVIELVALPDQSEQAVAQVRGLLGRLAQGAARPEDAELARRHFERLDQQAVLNPRHRIIRLWQGRARGPSADLASLRRFHRRALQPDKHVVVFVKEAP
jgi:hypothetical protein